MSRKPMISLYFLQFCGMKPKNFSGGNPEVDAHLPRAIGFGNQNRVPKPDQDSGYYFIGNLSFYYQGIIMGETYILSIISHEGDGCGPLEIVATYPSTEGGASSSGYRVSGLRASNTTLTGAGRAGSIGNYDLGASE
uniref:Uncharacterized protein n=1 Tax=Cannabis sativa TaxID=3483 RepID=A0A803QGI7_CANSA